MKLLFALIVGLFSLTLIGQQTNENLVIMGSVFDTDTHTPLQFVTITLQNKKTKEFTADITNKKGEFKLSVPKGKYRF
ncbi:MAG: carboxypeptidase-like regulatory domain-containing protein, partial [Flavobacteriaceae bacterium]|nr:carboxypeptidase-like regulatory domain-containing protein [Flavobacteriaceae bacterium]